MFGAMTVEQFLYFAMDDCEVGIFNLDSGDEAVFKTIDEAVAKYGNCDVCSWDVEDGHICLNIEE